MKMRKSITPDNTRLTKLVSSHRLPYSLDITRLSASNFTSALPASGANYVSQVLLSTLKAIATPIILEPRGFHHSRGSSIGGVVRISRMPCSPSLRMKNPMTFSPVGTSINTTAPRDGAAALEAISTHDPSGNSGSRLESGTRTSRPASTLLPSNCSGNSVTPISPSKSVAPSSVMANRRSLSTLLRRFAQMKRQPHVLRLPLSSHV